MDNFPELLGSTSYAVKLAYVFNIIFNNMFNIILYNNMEKEYT